VREIYINASDVEGLLASQGHWLPITGDPVLQDMLKKGVAGLARHVIYLVVESGLHPRHPTIFGAARQS